MTEEEFRTGIKADAPRSTKPILCVDFDGVIHSYERGWQGGEIYGTATPGFFAWAIAAVELFDIHIYSSRSKTRAGITAMQLSIGKWSIDAIHSGEVAADFEWPRLFDHLTFSNEKPPAFLTIDDRAICFAGDWSALDPATLLGFKPWNVKTPIETPAVTDDGIVTGTLFRVKPGVINAVRYEGIKDGAALFHIKDGVPGWLEEAMAAPEGPGAIWIPAAPEGADVKLPDIIVLGIKPDHVNPFGMIYVEPGDWILRFPDGLLAVMDDAGFRENYDQATDMDATTPTGDRVREAFDEGYNRGYADGQIRKFGPYPTSVAESGGYKLNDPAIDALFDNSKSTNGEAP